MKYEVTGDTIIIKYIADGKYKTLELDKNDNIDLDFFGQLINAKNNKQDAMCDLYAREVLTYEPSTERITTMSLTKPDEPSDYTKKEAAKLRIEELNRDLKSIKNELETMIYRQFYNKKVEDLNKDHLIDKEDVNINRLKELQEKYASIKEQLENEQKIYDKSTRKDDYTQDDMVKKISKEVESKLDKYVGDTVDKRRIMESIIDETTPQTSIQDELDKIEEISNNFSDILETYMERVKKGENVEEFEDQSEIKEEIKEEINEDSDNDANEIDDESLIINDDTKGEGLKNTLTKDEKTIINQLLGKVEFIKNQKLMLLDHIKLLEAILKKTNVSDNIKTKIHEIIILLRKLRGKNVIFMFKLLNDTINEIKELNNNNKIKYTQDTFKNMLETINKLTLENERIKRLYNKKISKKVIDEIIELIPKTSDTISAIIKLPPKNNFSIEQIIQIYNNAPNTLIWTRKGADGYIYSNKKLFDGFKSTKVIYNKSSKSKTNYEIDCFYIDTYDLQQETYSIFADYITTSKTNIKIPFQLMDLYLNLLPNTTNGKDEDTAKVTYNGYELVKSNMAEVIKTLTNLDDDDESAGKIDLDKADTDEKLSEIVRLLQSISYNLYTLTPNYEENQKNKKLKSKGVDLMELFD